MYLYAIIRKNNLHVAISYATSLINGGSSSEYYRRVIYFYEFLIIFVSTLSPEYFLERAAVAAGAISEYIAEKVACICYFVLLVTFSSSIIPR